MSTIRERPFNLKENSGKKIRTIRDKKNKYSNSCVVRKKNSERNKKPYPPPPPPPPFKLNGRSLTKVIRPWHNELFLPLSFMKMSISCLYWSSELGSLLSIVHVYLLSILKVTFSKSHKLWFIKKLKK